MEFLLKASLKNNKSDVIEIDVLKIEKTFFSFCDSEWLNSRKKAIESEI